MSDDATIMAKLATLSAMLDTAQYKLEEAFKQIYKLEDENQKLKQAAVTFDELTTLHADVLDGDLSDVARRIDHMMARIERAEKGGAQ